MTCPGFGDPLVVRAQCHYHGCPMKTFRSTPDDDGSYLYVERHKGDLDVTVVRFNKDDDPAVPNAVASVRLDIDDLPGLVEILIRHELAESGL